MIRVSEIAFEDMRGELENLIESEKIKRSLSGLDNDTWVVSKRYVLTKESTRLNRELNITQRKIKF